MSWFCIMNAFGQNWWTSWILRPFSGQFFNSYLIYRPHKYIFRGKISLSGIFRVWLMEFIIFFTFWNFILAAIFKTAILAIYDSDMLLETWFVLKSMKNIPDYIFRGCVSLSSSCRIAHMCCTLIIKNRRVSKWLLMIFCREYIKCVVSSAPSIVFTIYGVLFVQMTHSG